MSPEGFEVETAKLFPPRPIAMADTTKGFKSFLSKILSVVVAARASTTSTLSVRDTPKCFPSSLKAGATIPGTLSGITWAFCQYDPRQSAQLDIHSLLSRVVRNYGSTRIGIVHSDSGDIPVAARSFAALVEYWRGKLSPIRPSIVYFRNL